MNQKKAIIALCRVTIIYRNPTKAGTRSYEERISVEQLVLLNDNEEVYSVNEMNKIIRLTFMRSNTPYNPEKTKIININVALVTKHGLTTYIPE